MLLERKGFLIIEPKPADPRGRPLLCGFQELRPQDCEVLPPSLHRIIIIHLPFFRAVNRRSWRRWFHGAPGQPERELPQPGNPIVILPCLLRNLHGQAGCPARRKPE